MIFPGPGQHQVIFRIVPDLPGVTSRDPRYGPCVEAWLGAASSVILGPLRPARRPITKGHGTRSRDSHPQSPPCKGKISSGSLTVTSPGTPHVREGSMAHVRASW